MYFGVHVGTILLDLRYLAVILAVIIGGPIASTIAVSMILVTRLVFMDYSLASQVAFYTIIAIGIGSIFISRLKLSLGENGYGYIHIFYLF